MSLDPGYHPDLRCDSLHESPDNPRTISDDSFDRLCHTIENDPGLLQARPVIATPEGEVLAGNMRLRAVKALEHERIPAFVIADLTPAQRREIVTLDNASMGQWDQEGLAKLVAAHARESGDLKMLGLADIEVRGLLKLAEAPPIPDRDADLLGAVPEPICRPGDIVALGRHLLLCGDSLDRAALDRVYGVPVDAVVTDPPYGAGITTDYSGMKSGILPGAQGRTYREMEGGSEPFDARMLSSYFEQVREQFWFGADYYRRTLPGSDLEGSWLVWDKRTESADAGFGSGFELIWSRQAHKRDLLRHYWFGAFGGESRTRVHPTQKPVDLLVGIMDRWTESNAIVADPFLGSGSTLIACEKSGRTCIGVEIDPAYCDVILARWHAFTDEDHKLVERLPE